VSKLSTEIVVTEALDLLDEVGLDALSTRRLAKRLGVEQPSLYWHFRKKEDLLGAMAEAAMTPHARAPLPQPGDSWRDWLLENHRSLRRTLLLRRDGARLHAGSFPGEADVGRILRKMEFLASAGVPEDSARIAMFTLGRFTIGSVLEEQSEVSHRPANSDPPASGDNVPHLDHEMAFEAGLAMILDGLTFRMDRQAKS
jgi:TetR/AcrR family tetracycline transcriptional repressor